MNLYNKENFSEISSEQIRLNEAIYLENNFSSISSPKTCKQVVSVHGLGTYCGWFDSLRGLLAEKDIASLSMDLPGFGRSGVRGEIESYKSWIDAVKFAWYKANEQSISRHPETASQTSEKEIYLLGHSLGGIIALASLKDLNPKPKGIIITVPALVAHPTSFNPLTFVIPTFLKAISGSKEKISIPIPPETFESVRTEMHPINILTAYAEPKLFLEILNITNQAWLMVNQLKDIPLLMIVTEKDQVCLTQASKLFFELCNSPQKKLKVYSDLAHDLFVLPEVTEINKLICDWIETN